MAIVGAGANMPKPSRKRTATRTRPNALRFVRLEDRTNPSTRLFTHTDTWASPSYGTVTVTATVTADAPGYEGLFRWNYHVQNESFAPDTTDPQQGVGLFEVFVGEPEVVDNLDTTTGWPGQIGNLAGSDTTIWWNDVSGVAVIGPGGSGDFSYTTRRGRSSWAAAVHGISGMRSGRVGQRSFRVKSQGS